jgi:hypothetical protein
MKMMLLVGAGVGVMGTTVVVFLLVSVVGVCGDGELFFCQRWRSLPMADDDEVVGRVVLYLKCEGDGIYLLARRSHKYHFQTGAECINAIAEPQ